MFPLTDRVPFWGYQLFLTPTAIWEPNFESSGYNAEIQFASINYRLVIGHLKQGPLKDAFGKQTRQILSHLVCLGNCLDAILVDPRL